MEHSWLNNLQAALGTFNWAEAESICKRFIEELDASPTPYAEAPAKEALRALRRKRQFALMVLVADALVRGGQTAPEITRQYAQAMIDQGNLTASRVLLQSIIDDPKSPQREWAEAKGLLGRIHKQLYVNTNDPSNPRQQENLRQAIQHYFSVYKKDPRAFLWQGINTVGLLARARRDNVAISGLPSMRDIALEIDASLKQIEPLEYWDRATAIEDAVALGDINGAYGHALRYAVDQKADAFEIAALLRQLTEVWQLSSDTEPGNTLLPILRAALVKRDGGAFTLDATTVAAETKIVQNAGEMLTRVFRTDNYQPLMQFEKVFGMDRYQPFGWWQTGLERFKAVGRVETKMGRSVGTGFLVRARDFFAKRDEDELLFLTNFHVIPGAIGPEAARVHFEAKGKKYGVKKPIWSSPQGKLDATFLPIESLDQKAEFCCLEPPPEPFDLAKMPRVYIIGYPLGGGLSISLQDSILLDTDGRLLHYRTPTEPGSSGSPVFDQNYWTLIGLHHAGSKDMPRLSGGGTYEANEGIAITAIRQATLSWTDNQAAHAGFD